MDTLLYCLARSAVAFLQTLPLPAVARLGRAGGAMAWWLDSRHRRVALQNLALCFGADLIGGRVPADPALARRGAPGPGGRGNGLVARQPPPARRPAEPRPLFWSREVAGGNARAGEGKFSAHRRELRLRHQDGGHEPGRTETLLSICGGRKDPAASAPRGSAKP